MCRCCGCSPARPSRCSTARAASSRPWSSTWGAATCGCRWASHLPLEREAPRASAPGRRHAGQRADGLAGREGHGAGRGQHPAPGRASAACSSSTANARRRSGRTGRASPIAACEQCGRNRVPAVHEVMDMARWLAVPRARSCGWCCRWRPRRSPCCKPRRGSAPVLVLSGPEGGLTAQEEQAALAAGFPPVSLGARVLRAETAPLAAAGGT